MVKRVSGCWQKLRGRGNIEKAHVEPRDTKEGDMEVGHARILKEN